MNFFSIVYVSFLFAIGLKGGKKKEDRSLEGEPQLVY